MLAQATKNLFSAIDAYPLAMARQAHAPPVCVASAVLVFAARLDIVAWEAIRML
jgi:hypothetical protein